MIISSNPYTLLSTECHYFQKLLIIYNLDHLTTLCLVAKLCPTLCDPMDCSSPGTSVHGDSLCKNAGVGCHVLLQVIFTTQGSNPGLLHCRWILYHLSHQRSSPQNSQPTKRFVCPTPWMASAKNFPWFKHLRIILNSSPSPIHSICKHYSFYFLKSRFNSPFSHHHLV